MGRRRKRHEGFTVIELMIAMTLGLVLGGAIISVFVFNRHSFARDETVIRMQDDARQAVRELANDLSMAGFWADLIFPDAIAFDGGGFPGADECGPSGTPLWLYELDPPITFRDNATGAEAKAAFDCLNALHIAAGSDVIAIKRLAGTTTATPSGGVYMRTNGTLGVLYRGSEPTSPPVSVPAPFVEWEYRPSVYYVRNFGLIQGDGVPTLCRRTLIGSGLFEDCLAQGIENLQIEFGLDTNGNGEPNVFVADPTAAELERAVAARIYVLARSAERDIQYTNDKTYTIGNAPAYSPGDNFYRRVYSVTVKMHNLSNLMVLRGM